MDLIKKGLGLTKTFRNASRLRDIITVLSRNGFEEFFAQTQLLEKLPGFVLPKARERIFSSVEEYNNDTLSAAIGYRLRLSFEELGPSFVKLGQLLSTREDIFPPTFIAEMKKLQDQVKGIPFEEAVLIIESSMGKKTAEVFESISPTPIGQASIGVVFEAKLKTGESVVIKVRRPNIAKTIETDFSLLLQVLTQLEKASEDLRYLSLSRIIEDFARHINSELDYRIEALNAERLKTNIAKIDPENVFYLPKVYREISTDQVLILEKINGIPFSDSERIMPHKTAIQKKLEHGINVFVQTLLVDGFFHADLHGGNFFLMDNGQIGIIDFGFVGMMSRKNRTNLIAILHSLVNFNFENLVSEFLDVADYETIPDVDRLESDIKDTLSPYMGLTVQQMNFSILFRSLTTTLAQHQIYLPREWFVMFRAMVTLDGVGKSLNMDFDIFGIMSRDIQSVMGEILKPDQLKEDALWIGRDVLNSLRTLPRHVRWILRETAKRNYAIETIQRGYESEFNRMARAIKFIGFTIVAAVFFVGGIYAEITHQSGTTALSTETMIFFGIGLLFFGAGFWTSKN